MKKIAIPITILMVILLCCLTGCNTNFKFKDLELSSENVTEITVVYGKDKKITSNSEKMDRVFSALDSLDIEKFKDKVADNVFNDSVVGKISMQLENKKGSFEMTFVETIVNGEKTSLLKCDTTEGLKIKKLSKGIYKMASVTDANALLIALFVNCM